MIHHPALDYGNPGFSQGNRQSICYAASMSDDFEIWITKPCSQYPLEIWLANPGDASPDRHQLTRCISFASVKNLNVTSMEMYALETEVRCSVEIQSAVFFPSICQPP